MKIVNAKKLHKKSDKNTVTRRFENSDLMFDVFSGTSEKTYSILAVNGGGWNCNCRWGKLSKKGGKMQSACNHVQSVVEFLEAEKGRRTSAWSDRHDPNGAQRQHRPITETFDGVKITSRK